MFSDDEDELELLRQYGERDLNADESDAHSSDEMDSDLEDKIMSMVQYGSGLSKKFVPASTNPPKPTTATPTPTPTTRTQKKTQKRAETIYAPIDQTTKKSSSSNFSAANMLQINSDDSEEEDEYREDSLSEDSDEEESEEEEDIGTPPPLDERQEVAEEPRVTRYINLDDEKHYMDDEETSDEEAELGIKLQELIDDQIRKRQIRSKFVGKPIRVCFGCQQPGHERRDCTLCADCGGPKHVGEGRCVGARYCGRCKMRGHNAVDCPNKRENNNCRFCHMSYHAADNCPSLLHVYVNEVRPTKTPTPFCYNCTTGGHYGDECPSLPNYLQTMPSAFSSLSLSEGSRFDPRKTMRTTASSFASSTSSRSLFVAGPSSQHQRWSDDSREGSPRPGYHNKNKKRKYNDDSDYEYKHKSKGKSKTRYEDSDNDSYNSSKKKRKGKDKAISSYKDNQAGGKRRRTDLDNQPSSSSRPTSHLDQFFTPNSSSQKKPKRDNITINNNAYTNSTGNSNWKAMNNNALPQPIRNSSSGNSSPFSSTTKNKKKQREQQQNYDVDFPRGNGNSEQAAEALPRPSSSGVIDLTRIADGGSYSKRAPKYHGGYNRNR